MADNLKGDNKATTTAIGASIVIRGKLKSNEDLVVKGRIEAEVTSTKAFMVENSGVIKANVNVQSAKISGVLVGNVTAQQKIEIAPDGRVVGDLLAPRIVLNDGASFRGKIDMQAFDSKAEAVTPKAEVMAHTSPTNDVMSELPPLDAPKIEEQPKPYSPVLDSPPRDDRGKRKRF